MITIKYTMSKLILLLLSPTKNNSEQIKEFYKPKFKKWKQKMNLQSSLNKGMAV